MAVYQDWRAGVIADDEMIRRFGVEGLHVPTDATGSARLCA